MVRVMVVRVYHSYISRVFPSQCKRLVLLIGTLSVHSGLRHAA